MNKENLCDTASETKEQILESPKSRASHQSNEEKTPETETETEPISEKVIETESRMLLPETKNDTNASEIAVANAPKETDNKRPEETGEEVTAEERISASPTYSHNSPVNNNLEFESKVEKKKLTDISSNVVPTLQVLVQEVLQNNEYKLAIAQSRPIDASQGDIKNRSPETTNNIERDDNSVDSNDTKLNDDMLIAVNVSKGVPSPIETNENKSRTKTPDSILSIVETSNGCLKQKLESTNTLQISPQNSHIEITTKVSTKMPPSPAKPIKANKGNEKSAKTTQSKPRPSLNLQLTKAGANNNTVGKSKMETGAAKAGLKTTKREIKKQQPTRKIISNKS